jgi:hypothetical protein
MRLKVVLSLPEQQNRTQPMAQETTTRLAANMGFPQFRRLPPELRMQVWRQCLPTNRTICAKLIWQSAAFHPKLSIQRHDIPAALAVCRESREETLRVYRPLFQPNPSLQVYVHIDSDTLHLDENLDRNLSPRTIEFPLLNFPPCQLMDIAFGLAGMPAYEIGLYHAMSPGEPCFWCRINANFDLKRLYGPDNDVESYLQQQSGKLYWTEIYSAPNGPPCKEARPLN